MYCSQCGNEIKEGARFCGNCGAQVPASANDTGAVLAPSTADEVPAGAAVKKSHMPVIAAGIAGLVMSAALLFFVTQCSQTTQQPVQETAHSMQAETSASSEPAPAASSESTSAASSEPTSSASSEAAPSTPSDPAPSAENSPIERNLTPEEEFIANLDGWWEKAVGSEGTVLCYIHDGVLVFYSHDGERLEGGRTYQASDLLRMEEGIGGRPDQYTAGPGWFIYGADHSEYGSYVSDDDPNFMQNINIDGTGYTSGNALARVAAPEWADRVEVAAVDDGEQGSLPSTAVDVNEIIEGWWIDQETGVYIKHITDGKVREYLDFRNGRYEGGNKTVDVVAERVEEPPAPGMPSGPGWTLRLSGPDNSLVHYLADSDANMMYCAGFDGTAFPAGYIVRMQPSDALANYAASMEGGSTDAPQASPGEVVLTGTVVATTYAQRQSDLGLPASTGFADNYGELVLLQLDSEVQVNGLNGDFQGRSTRPASSVLLGSEWASRAGEHVSIAVAEEDFEWFSDTMGALVSVSVHNNNVREL